MPCLSLSSFASRTFDLSRGSCQTIRCLEFSPRVGNWGGRGQHWSVGAEDLKKMSRLGMPPSSAESFHSSSKLRIAASAASSMLNSKPLKSKKRRKMGSRNKAGKDPNLPKGYVR